MPQTVFDLLSLIYVFLGARVIWTAWRRWREFTDAELTTSDRRLADQLAFFVLIPPGVFLHELGHAVATMQLGGRVAQFHYALFWGFVAPVGNFTRLGEWWIAVSGNLVSIVCGMLALPLLLLVRTRWQKYLLLSFARVQLSWSLIGYPAFTLLGFEGDWKTIYSPRTLNIGIPFAVFHILLIAALRLLNRHPAIKRWELSLYAGVAERLRALNVEPLDPERVVDRGNLFAECGETRLALAEYRRALRLDPGNLRALYNIGQIELAKKNLRAAENYFRSALAQADDNHQLAARAHFGLGMILTERGVRADAVREFDQAIALNSFEADFHYWRGLALRSLGQAARAQLDFERAAELAAGTNSRVVAGARHLIGKETGKQVRR